MKIEGVPTHKDPRLLIIVFFVFFITYALTAAGFGRTWQQLVLSLGTCLAIDLTCNWVLDKRIIFPMSALVTGSGVFLLVDSPIVAATGFAALFAILSKHAIRIRGQHIFNPNNFGVVLAFFAFPDWIISGAHRWAGNPFATVTLFLLGTAIVIRADRWAASFGYAFSFLAFNLLRSVIFAKPYWVYSISLLGPAMQLFIFFMVSDPRTSPNDRKRQLAYGMMVAALDNFLRHTQHKDAPLISLFIVCGVYNLYRAWKPDVNPFTVWKMRAIEVRRNPSPL